MKDSSKFLNAIISPYRKHSVATRNYASASFKKFNIECSDDTELIKKVINYASELTDKK